MTRSGASVEHSLHSLECVIDRHCVIYSRIHQYWRQRVAGESSCCFAGIRIQSTRVYPEFTSMKRTRRTKDWVVIDVEENAINCGFLFEPSEPEECCISCEDITKTQTLYFAADTVIHVDKLHPTLTGVQLTCGHRFGAVPLLWYWVCAPMTCPVCRHDFRRAGAKTQPGGSTCAVSYTHLRAHET